MIARPRRGECGVGGRCTYVQLGGAPNDATALDSAGEIAWRGWNSV